MTPLPLDQRGVRGFQIFTQEGSCFFARFEPQYEDSDVDEIYGSLVVVGRLQGAARDTRIEGIGVVPCPGGRVITSAVPERTYTLNGEIIKEYPYQIIARVIEFQVPPTP